MRITKKHPFVQNAIEKADVLQFLCRCIFKPYDYQRLTWNKETMIIEVDGSMNYTVKIGLFGLARRYHYTAETVNAFKENKTNLFTKQK